MSLFFDFHHESGLAVVGEFLRLGKVLEPSFISIPSGAPGIGRNSLNFGKNHQCGARICPEEFPGVCTSFLTREAQD